MSPGIRSTSPPTCPGPKFAASSAPAAFARSSTLTEAQARSLLGGVASSTWHAWKTNPRGKQLDQDTLTRISLSIGIYKALNIYFNKPLADRWITLGNRGPMFAGHSPLEYMIQNGVPGMVDVRRMLDAWRGGV